ncbi:hypothetical protein D3C87_1556090 [compost metagenome]
METPEGNNQLLDDEAHAAHGSALIGSTESSRNRLVCPPLPHAGGSVSYIAHDLLRTMLNRAKDNYRNGYSPDSMANVESLRGHRQELVEYCRDHGIKLPDSHRDQSGNAPVEAWVAHLLEHFAAPATITVHAFHEGMDSVPHVRLTLS